MKSNIVKSEVTESEVVENHLQGLEPIVVRASLQLLAHPTEVMAAKTALSIEALRNDISRQQKKPVVLSRYVRTLDAANFIGVDPSFLDKRKGTVFRQGKHFFKPHGKSIVRWDIEALQEWITEGSKEGHVDDELAALLERS